MLKKPGESNTRKIDGFKKFSEVNKTKANNKETTSYIDEEPFSDSDLPANHNLPDDGSYIQNKKELVTKREVTASTKAIRPPVVENTEDINENVNMIGRVAKFPKNKKIKASKAYNFLENVKISKNSIWYIMVERQDNELQMIKYNYKEGVNLNEFLNELKTFYIKKYSKVNKNLPALLEKMKVDGTDKFSSISDIPFVELGGKKLISIITEDLIRLLSK